MNAFAVNSSLSDLLANPEYTRAELLQLRGDLAAHQRTRDGLEYLLFCRVSLLRKLASRAKDGETIIRLHSEADALVELAGLLFGNLREEDLPHTVKV